MKLFKLTNNDLYYINHSKILTFKQIANYGKGI